MQFICALRLILTSWFGPIVQPLGVFHDIHNYGKLNYDPHLRVIDTIKGTYGLKWNGGIQYRYAKCTRAPAWLEQRD